MTNIKRLLIGSAAALGTLSFGAAANAATVFSADIEADQSATPDLGEDVSAAAVLNLEERSPGVYALTMTVDFSDGFDFSRVVDELPGRVSPFGVTGEVPTEGFDVTRFHIHDGSRGESGPIVFGLFDVLVPSAVSDEDTDTRIDFNDDGSAVLTSEWDYQEGTDDGLLSDFIGELLAAAEGEDVSLYFNLHSEDAPAGLIRGQIVAENGVVPIPAAAVLFVPALAAGGFLRRRKQRA